MYGYRAEDRRRCLTITRNGEPCRQWAMWDDPEGACYAHADPRTRHNRRVGASPAPAGRTTGRTGRAAAFAAGPTRLTTARRYPPARTAPVVLIARSLAGRAPLSGVTGWADTAATSSGAALTVTTPPKGAALPNRHSPVTTGDRAVPRKLLRRERAV